MPTTDWQLDLMCLPLSRLSTIHDFGFGVWNDELSDFTAVPLQT